MGKQATLIESIGQEDHRTSFAAWVLVGPPELLESRLIRNVGIAIQPSYRVRIWTDDFNNIFQILK